jgi:hypothetical protein
MMYAHIQEEPPSLVARRPDLPRAVDEVIGRGMAKNADERWGTCGELLDALGAAFQRAGEAPSAEELQPARATRPGAPPAEPEAAPVAPALEGVSDIDYRGSRYGLGRTQDAYAVWDCHAGGPPLATFPKEASAWQEAWQTYQELEASPARDRATMAEARGELDDRHRRPSGPGGPLLIGVVFLDYRGEKFALGRAPDGYAIWDMAQGGAPLRQYPLSPEAWQEAWARYQDWEAGEAQTAAEAQRSGASGAGESGDLAGVVSLDFRGAGYGLGRTSTGYAIWDLGAGGQPILTFPMSAEAWEQAWQAYQQLEQREGIR